MGNFLTLEEVVRKRPVNEKRAKKLVHQILTKNSAARLAEMRKAQDLTQKELAKKVGIDQSNISRIERGKFSDLEFNSLQNYIEALGGKLEIHARFGEHSLLLIDSEYEKALVKAANKRRRTRK
ncbi:MAG: XRE family transcriptional regulator [Actinomycetales bacterium]|nr:XRE family transcriptional regulator [Actinomycetales bacterium]